MSSGGMRGFTVAAVLIAMLLAACGGVDPETTGSTDGDGATDQTANEGTETTAANGGGEPPDEPMVFRYAWQEPDKPLDGRQATTGSTEIASNLYEGLLDYSAEGEVEPLGAESYDISSDGLTYTFNLRTDVLWSDGAPVTAGDYEFAWKTALEPELASPTSAQLFVIENAEAFNTGEITSSDEIGVRAIDDYTLEVRLRAPIGDFLAQAATSAIYWPIPQHVVELFDAPYEWTEAGNNVSNGPFHLEEWVHNDHMVLVPNSHYWRDKPLMDEIQIRLLPDPSSQALAPFEAGDLDFAIVPNTELSRIQADPELSEMLGFAEIPRLYAIFVDASHPPFDDVNVRKAFYLAIDRETLSNDVFGGLTTPAWQMIPHGVPSHNPDIRLEGDAEDAKRFLADAGYPNGDGFPQQMMFLRNTQLESLQGQAIQAMWKAVLNVDIEIELLEPQAFRETQIGQRAGNSYDLQHLSATADGATPATYHDIVIARDGEGYFPVRWTNPQYTALLDEVAAEPSFEKELELYQEAERILIDEAVIFPVSNENFAYLVRPGFEGLVWPFGVRGPIFGNLRFEG